jgi:CheY-like chemotaxis protein
VPAKAVVTVPEGARAKPNCLGAIFAHLVNLADGTEKSWMGANVERIAKLRVLIVDDEVEIKDTMTFFLSFSGHEVRSASTGEEAIQIAGDFVPHVILMDIQMPGKSGWETVRQLREQPNFANTFCVALTGLQSEQDRRRSLEAGFDLHLVKPVDSMALQVVLEKAARRAADGSRPP